MVHSMSKNLFDDAKVSVEDSIFAKDVDKLYKTFDYFFSRFLESEEEFKKTHSKESQNKVMCYREIAKKIIEAKDLLLEENIKKWLRKNLTFM